MSGLGFLSLLNRKSDVVLVDVGSAMTKVMWRGQVVWHEPSLVVVDEARQNLLAMGTAASNLSGKLTPGLSLAPVMVNGQISDTSLFSLFVQSLHQKLSHTRLDQILGLPVIYSQNAATSDFNRQLLRQTWQNAGWQVKTAVAKHQALHAALPRPFLCVVDHGGATTEVVVYSQAKLLLTQTLPIGGQRYTRRIIDLIRDTNGVVMSWAGAEQVKFKIGRVSIKDEVSDTPTKISVRASQTAMHTQQTLVLHSDQFLASLNQEVDELCQQLTQCFSQLSQEAMMELSQHGIILCGGGAALKGLAARASAALSLPITVAASPELCLVKGLFALGVR